ncbi:MAG: aspartyl/glutamyl-tRNA amidotransferase subunit C [Candidatus Pacebacteria bacterium]|nr:aspartyl/glutamyl-tRNA amidotransferase subunit C [Candidatus Paceibacterota bacterium]
MTKPDIKALSRLARIDLSEEETRSLENESENILAFVEQIQGAQASSADLGVQLPSGELNSLGAVFNVFRDDVNPHESGIYTDAILAQAPEREGNYIRVKKIL